ncbi:MAG: PIN domain-containing protein [Burkholderiales bacterium]
MPDRFFLDTNVLVYLYSNTEPGKRKIVQGLASAPGAIVSTQVLSELANVLKKKFTLPEAQIAKVIDEITSACDVTLVNPEMILASLRLAEKYRYSFYDSLIIAASLASGANFLYSEDLQHGQRIESSLVIKSPFRRKRAKSAN